MQSLLQFGFGMRAGGVAALLVAAGSAIAQPVLVTVPTTIQASDTTILGVPLATAQITVQGTTLTMNGRHTIGSLSIERSVGNVAGVLTHSANTSFDYSGGANTDVVRGLVLTVNGSVFVQGSAGGVSSRIDLQGRGYPERQGLGTTSYVGGGGGGGAGHGGSGGDGSNFGGGNSVGSFDAPGDFGSGGSGNCCSSATAGGGRLQLWASGTVTIDGEINADAQALFAGNGGGGAGGSVWLRGVVVSGAGSVFARGGNAPAGWGAGGGGRIRIDSTGLPTISTLAADARGGTSPSMQAGAGSVARGAMIGPAMLVREVVFDNFSAVTGDWSEMSGTVDVSGRLIVRGGAVVGPFAGDDTLHIIGRTGIEVLANSAISADGRGFAGRTGPGITSYLGSGGGSGAGHGGAGFDSANTGGGDTYGSITAPITMGSGGSGTCCSTPSAGGGAVRVTSTGDFVVQGRISANAISGTTGNGSGGGSGGSVWITVDPTSGGALLTLAPTASVTATGGGVPNGFGGGGGGRIAIYTPASIGASSMNIVSAAGGAAVDGSRRGGAGTVYFDNVGAGGAPGTLYVDNKVATLDSENTELTGAVNLDAGLVVQNGGILGPKHGDDSLAMTFAGPVVIDATGALNASRRGFASRLGPGSVSYLGGGSGGGAAHGGAGSDGNNSGGGDTYGSFLMPITMGSGGGGNCCTSAGAGGGVIRLTTASSFVNNGIVMADGQGGSSGNGGGGAGGSVYLTTGAASGTGVITANGGNGVDANWGGGGGGRISLTSSSFAIPLTNIRAFGGTGGRGVAGGAGTVWIKPTAASAGTLYLKNNSLAGEATEMTGDVSVPGNLVVEGAALLAPKQGDASLHVTVTGNATIASDGAAGADFRGFAERTGPGTMSYLGGGAGGGAGHGGAGEDGSNALGGGTYGSFSAPDTMGSGGTGNCCTRGGFGGGALRLSVTGNLTVDGRLSANAENGFPGNGGGGAGGSLRLSAAQLLGSGTIEARGANGADNNWGNGGGGRVSLTTTNSSMPFTLANFNLGGGTLGSKAGGAGTLFVKSGAAPATLIIDNDGAVLSETTEITGVVVVDGNLLVDNGAILGPVQRDASLDLTVNGNVVVGSAGRISADDRGFAGGEGPGSLPYFGGGAGGGGGHGGVGAAGNNFGGGLTYGDATNPVTMGSGGGGNCCTSAGAGGGVINITSLGSMDVSGVISANGQGGAPGNGGGGAGGSVRLRAGTGLTGLGFVRAQGGAGVNATWGGGGGGRVAIYSCNITMPLSNITATGGTGGVTPSGAGSVYFGSGSINITTQPGSVTLVQGISLQLDVVASSTLGPVTYQWRRFGIPVLEGDYDGRATGTQTSTLLLSSVDCFVEGNFDCLITDSCGSFPSSVAIVETDNGYNSIDFNRDGLFPDDTDLVDFLTVLAGGSCSTEPSPGCDTIDFNNDGLFPDDTDLVVFLRILAGGEC